MEKIVSVVLAAGKGTRMVDMAGYNDLPKVMAVLAGHPMISYCLDNLQRAGVDKKVVVVGYKQEIVREYLDGEVEYAEQDLQLGTGHAVLAAKGQLRGKYGSVLVCYGDMPLYKPETIRKLIEEYDEKCPAIAMLSVNFEDPIFWAYGRIIRDKNGNVVKIVEQKDCDEKQLKIKECNPGFYIFEAKWLWENIDKLQANNSQGEFYLTDLIGLANEQKKKIVAVPVNEESEAMGINTFEQLKRAEEVLVERSKEYADI